MSNLETIYLVLKIISLALALIAGTGLGVITLYQIYKNHKEFIKEEKERKVKEAKDLLDPKIIKEREEQKERMGLKPTPGSHYKHNMRCYNCDTSRNIFFIPKGILEEEFRKTNSCYSGNNSRNN